MISTVLLVLLVGGCAGLPTKPEKAGKPHQKDVPMTTMSPNSTSSMMNATMTSMMPMWNMTTMGPGENGTMMTTMFPNSTNGMMNFTMTSMMPTWNMTTMGPGENGTMMTTMFPNSTDGMMNFTMTSTMPMWNMTTATPENVTMMSTTPGSNMTYPGTTMMPTTMTPPPGNGSCGGIIFVQQMTRDLTYMNKMDFFNITRSLVSQLHEQARMAPYSYAYAQYGSVVYKGINMSDYFDFMRDLDQAQSNFTMMNTPNGGYAYLQPILTEILNHFSMNQSSRPAVLLMGEDSSIRDPYDAYAVAQSISYMNANIYVLDYSYGVIPLSIWPTLTNNRAYHIVDGSGLTQEQIVSQFSSTLINDVMNGMC